MRWLATKDLNPQCLGYIIVCALAHWSSWTPTRLTNGSLSPVMGFFSSFFVPSCFSQTCTECFSCMSSCFGGIKWRCLAQTQRVTYKTVDACTSRKAPAHRKERPRSVFSPSTDTRPQSTARGEHNATLHSHKTTTKQSSWVRIHALSLDNSKHTRCLKDKDGR